MTYKVTINKDDCIGCGSCTVCDNWEIGDDFKAHAKQEIIDDANLECNQEAESYCPVTAIKIIDV